MPPEAPLLALTLALALALRPWRAVRHSGPPWPWLAWWAVIGLLVTSFAFLGVNMFLSGLHSYGTL